MNKLKWQMFLIETAIFFGFAALDYYVFKSSMFGMATYFATAFVITCYFKWRYHE